MSLLNYMLLNSRIMQHCQMRTNATACLLGKDITGVVLEQTKIISCSCLFSIQKRILKASSSRKYFSTTSDKDWLPHQSKVTKELKSYFEKNKVRLRDTEYKIKEKSNILLEDIKSTRNKVKGKVDEVIEVLCCLFVVDENTLSFFREKTSTQFLIFCVYPEF